ncbi:molybdopterin-containing oxidoreductase family protein, partial [Enterocloster bolteae]
MEKRGVCGMCHNKCDIVATLEHGRLVKVEADSKSPRGRVCPRGKKSPEIVYSEKRILHPLIRCGEKGEGRFRRATWDEALTCASRGFLDIIRNYGPQALASYYGGSGLEDSMRANAGLFRVFGSPNDMGPGSICNTSSCVFTPMTTYGVTEAVLVKDIGHSEIIFCWGKNPKTDSGPLSAYRAILEAKERGAKLVVIDPCRAGMGEMADMWVPIIPGSDGALAMAMTKLILERHLYDEGFVKNYTRGFEAYEAYLKTLSVDRLSKCCGIPVRIIEELTRLFLSTEKISLVSYTGLEYQLSGVQNNRAIQILWAITGKVDVEGGIYINGTGIPTRKPATKQEIMPLGAEQYPVFYGLTGCGQFMEFPNAVLHDVPYPVRGLLIRAASPAISYPEQKLWRQVYKKLDFMVVLDRFMTEDAKYADVVLPATTLWENDSFCEYPGG